MQKKDFLFTVTLFLSSVLTLLGQPVFTAQAVSLTTQEAQTISSRITDYDVFSIDLVSLANHFDSISNTAILNLPGLPAFSITMEKHEIRSPGFQLIEYSSNGVHISDGGPCFTYLGTVNNINNQSTTQYLSSTFWRARFKLNGVAYGIMQINHFLNKQNLLFAVYELNDAVGASSSNSCGVVTSSNINTPPPTSICTDTPDSSLEGACPGWNQNSTSWRCDPMVRTDPGFNYEMELGIATDFEFVVEHGGTVESAMGDISEIILATNSDIFIKYLRTELKVSTIVIHSEGATLDPYDSGLITDMADEVMDDWATHPDAACARYDAVQLFTGKSGVGAAGYVKPVGVGAVCGQLPGFNPPFQPNPAQAFGVSRHSNSALPNHMIVAHELIHNIGLGSHSESVSCIGDPCSSNSFSYVMCSEEAFNYNGTPALLGDRQCRVMGMIISAGCCLETTETPDPICDNCFISTSITADNLHPYSACSSEDVIDFTATVCNDCDERTMQVVLEIPFQRQQFSEWNQTIFPDDPIISPSGGSLEKLFSTPIFFSAGECQTFNFTTDVISFNTSFTTSVSLISQEDGEDAGGGSSININPANTTTIINSGTISNLTNSYPFLDPSIACSEPNFRNISLTGTLEIDVPNYCLQNYRFLMGEDAKIIIQQGINVNANNVSFIGCNDMWDAIYVEPGATLEARNCRFEQAKRAAIYGSDAIIRVFDSDFVDNKVGILAKGDLSPTSEVLVQGSRFSTEDGLFDPQLDSKGYAGIQLSRVRNCQVLSYFEEVTNQRLPTTFTNLRNGIVASFAHVDAEGVRFKDMILDLNGRGPTGYGIHLSGRQGWINGLSLTDSATDEPPGIFENCAVGIYVNGAFATVTDCELTDVKRGIVAEDCKIRAIRFNNNDINATLTGIQLMDNQPASLHAINNVITMVNDPVNVNNLGTGLLYAEGSFGIPNYNSNKIHDNTITMQDGRNGILVRGGTYTHLFNNYIHLEGGSYGQRAIHIAGAYKPLLSFNHSFGPATGSYTNLIGILGDGLSKAELECNQHDRLDKGIWFQNLSEGTDLRGNVFEEGARGLQLGVVNSTNNFTSATIGGQVQRGNIWNGPFTEWGAFHASDEQEDWLASSFEINTSSNNNQFLPSNNVASGLWFDDDPNSTSNIFVCPTAPPPPTSDDYYDKPDALEDAVINDQFELSGYETASKWIARRRLLRRWTDPQVTGFGDSKFTQFINDQENTVAEDFHKVKLELDAALRPSEIEMQPIWDSYNDLNAVTGPLRQNADALATGVPNAVAERDTLLAELAEHGDSLSSLAVTKYNVIENHLLSLSGLIQALPQSQGFELYEKDMQDVFVRSSTGNLVATDSLKLLQIAERCPLIDGDAVYHARALYARFDPDRIFDNGLYCQPTQQSFRAQLPVEESTQLRLFPNPAENYVLVQADQSIEVESVRVFNATGQQQEVETLAGEDFQLFLGTERLPSGVYFVQLRLVNAEGVMSQKFIIQRD